MSVSACWFDEMATYTAAASSITITASTTDTAWYVFAGQAVNSASASAHWVQWSGSVAGQCARRTQGQQAQAAARAQAFEQEYRRFTEEAGLAQRRARALLVQHLTPVQRHTYEERGYFDIEVAGKTYRIRQGTHGNVRLLERAIETTPEAQRPVLVEKVSFCAQPGGVPTEDAMLAQKLMLESNERQFLEIANWTDLATGRLMDKRLALQEMR